MCHRGKTEVLADIPNDPALARKARALIDRPEV